MSEKGEGSDVITKPSRLDRGTIGVAVLILAIAGSLRLGIWWGGDRAEVESGTAKQLATMERVFTERANQVAASQIAELGKIRLDIQSATAQLMAAIQASGERVSLLERDIRTWVALLDAQNPTLTTPHFGGK